jgi:hypothetical protein
MMSRILIEEVKRKDIDFDTDGAVIVAVKYTLDGETKWLINNCSCGVSSFYESDEDLSEKFADEGVLEGDELEELADLAESTSIDSFIGFDFEDGDNDDIIDMLSVEPEDDVTALLKFIMNLTVCDKLEAEDLIDWGTGKYTDEIYDVPCDFTGMSDEEKFRLRLQIESDVFHDTVFHYIYIDEYDKHRKILKKLVPETDDERYRVWKEDFINRQFAVTDRERIITVSYTYAGIGRYTEVMHEDDFDVFADFIADNSAATMGGKRQATDDEVKLYIALNVDVE